MTESEEYGAAMEERFSQIYGGPPRKPPEVYIPSGPQGAMDPVQVQFRADMSNAPVTFLSIKSAGELEVLFLILEEAMKRMQTYDPVKIKANCPCHIKDLYERVYTLYRSTPR